MDVTGVRHLVSVLVRDCLYQYNQQPCRVVMCVWLRQFSLYKNVRWGNLFVLSWARVRRVARGWGGGVLFRCDVVQWWCSVCKFIGFLLCIFYGGCVSNKEQIKKLHYYKGDTTCACILKKQWHTCCDDPL